MAASTNKRKIKQGGMPKDRSFGAAAPGKSSFWSSTPDSAMQQHPSWNFASCDMEPDVQWSFCKENLADSFWETIFPKLQDFERMTLAQIFITAKKQNHGIDIESLSPLAQERLDSLKIEAESLHSLRLGGKLRLYGILNGSVFSVIWYDDDHGDNDTCVCRSRKKNT